MRQMMQLLRQANDFAAEDVAIEIEDAKARWDEVEAEFGRVDTELNNDRRSGQQLQVANSFLAILMHVACTNGFHLRGTGDDLQQRLGIAESKCVDPSGADFKRRMMQEQDRWLSDM